MFNKGLPTPCRPVVSSAICPHDNEELGGWISIPGRAMTPPRSRGAAARLSSIGTGLHHGTTMALRRGSRPTAASTTARTAWHRINRRRPVVASLMLGVAVGATSVAFAAAPPATSATPSAAAHAQRPPNLFQRLNLTDSQKSSVRNLTQESFAKARPELQALQEKRMAFNQATPGSANYQAVANDLAQAQSTAAHAEVLREADLRTKIYELLTPTQRKQLASIQAQRRAQIQQRRQARSAPAASH